MERGILQMLTLETGRPSDCTGRLEREIATYDLLDRLGIPYARVDHEAAFTMAACEEIDRVLAPAVICKNLFLCNTQGSQFYLLMLREDKRFRTKDISGQLGVARLSFAPEERLQELLGLTPGSVSVLGLMNDRVRRVRLLIDRDILTSEWFGCHPCINTSSLRLRVRDLTDRFLPAIGHSFTPVMASGAPKE